MTRIFLNVNKSKLRNVIQIFIYLGTSGYILKPPVMWNSGHILFERFLPASKTQEGLHATHISLTIVSGQYVCRENYSASPLVEVEVSLFLTKTLLGL